MKIKYLEMEEALKLLEQEFGVKSTQQLTKKQAIILIEKLVAMQEAS